MAQSLNLVDFASLTPETLAEACQRAMDGCDCVRRSTETPVRSAARMRTVRFRTEWNNSTGQRKFRNPVELVSKLIPASGGHSESLGVGTNPLFASACPAAALIGCGRDSAEFFERRVAVRPSSINRAA